MDWIKCDDRKPEDGQQVLVAILHRFVNRPKQWDLWLAKYDARQDVYRQWGVGVGLMVPAYWMPRPPDPPMPPEDKP